MSLQSFAALLVLVAIAHAEEGTTPVPILKQINKINDDGSYTYGFESADGSFRIETRDASGNVKGKYGYMDETGQLKTVQYTSGNSGFEATGDHFPEPVRALPVPVPQSVPAARVDQQLPASFFPTAPVVQAPALNQVRFAPQPVFQPGQVFAPQPAQVFAPQPVNAPGSRGFSFGFNAPVVVGQPQLNQFVPQQFSQQPFPGQTFVNF